MQNSVLQIHKKVWKGSLILISYFLLAACMQYDEDLRPKNAQDLSGDAQADNESSVAAWHKNVFTAHLNSGNEINPAGPVISKGQGQAIISINEDGTALHYKVIVANIDSITQAHIHCGGPTDNGPVVAFLFGFVASGVTLNGILAEGTITADDVIARPDSQVCSGGIATLADLIERIRTGGAYVNVHTIAYPGGEIRGQLK